MPSVIFHLTEAKLITQHLRETSADYPFTHIHGWQNDFTIGSILPDAIPRPLKYKTHFWHPSDFSHVVIAPDLNLWQKTYPNTLKEPMLIGYLAHLHLDYLYFTEYLPSIVRFLNEQGLDEPCAGLDPAITAEFYSLIDHINKEQGVTILMVSHDLDQVEQYASHIIMMNQTVEFDGDHDAWCRRCAEEGGHYHDTVN